MGSPRFLLIGALVALAACPAMDSLARPKKPPVVEAPPPPPPPPGPVGLPARMIDDAAAYEAYLGRVSAIAPVFTNPAQVAAALRVGAAYEPKAFIRGAVAYGAIAALQVPDFVAAIRAAGPTPDQRRLMVNAIIADPAFVFGFKGSDAAAGLAKQALGEAGMRLYNAGKAVKQASYDVQRQDWSKTDVLDRPGRLAAVKASSVAPIAPAADRSAILAQAASGAAPLAITAPRASPPYTTLLARALQLAAVAALGEAGEDAYDRLTYLTYEGATATCLNMAKLNLYQCLAVAKPNYEDIFCTGQHVMQDTGECLARNAGVTMPLELEAPPPLRVPPAIQAHYRARRRRG
ncbi:MAG: hypothetical protein ACYC8V_03425 [Caulobacteraceae bacterium]